MVKFLSQSEIDDMLNIQINKPQGNQIDSLFDAKLNFQMEIKYIIGQRSFYKTCNSYSELDKIIKALREIEGESDNIFMDLIIKGKN